MGYPRDAHEPRKLKLHRLLLGRKWILFRPAQLTLMIDYIFQDWKANELNPKGRFVLCFFRLSQLLARLPKPWWYLGVPVLTAYVGIVIWMMGIELDYRTKVGRGLRLYHGVGLVIHRDVKIGAHCMLRHGVTIGLRGGKEPCPVLEDHVEVGANAVIIGPINIGHGAIVGAGSIVLRDVEAGAVVAGNPAKVIKTLSVGAAEFRSSE